MSAERQPQRAPRIPVVNDDDLRYLIDRRHPTALHLILYVRKRAMLKGRLEVAVTNTELARELGVDRRQVQKAKAYLRRQGFPIEERWGRHRGPTGKSGSLACNFVLDRRRIEGLGRFTVLEGGAGHEEHGGAVPETVLDRGTKQHPPEERLRLALQEGVGRAQARDGPPSSAPPPQIPNREPAPDAPVGASVPLRTPSTSDPGLPRAAELEPELTQLREWWTAARGAAVTGQRATALLDRAEAHVVAGGGSAFRAKLARKLLEIELGAGQLELGAASDDDEVPRSGELPGGRAPDDSRNGEGAAPPTTLEGRVT